MFGPAVRLVKSWKPAWRRSNGETREEDTVSERDLYAIFKSSATSILSSFPDPFSPSLSLPLCSLELSLPKYAGYRNTSLSRPRGLTLTRHHPLYSTDSSIPCHALDGCFLNFVSAWRREREGATFCEAGAREGGKGDPSVLKVTIDRGRVSYWRSGRLLKRDILSCVKHLSVNCLYDTILNKYIISIYNYAYYLIKIITSTATRVTRGALY